MRHRLIFVVGVVCALAVSAAFVRSASAVNPHCYANRAARPGSLLWWADCADNWAPRAFKMWELKAARGRPRRVSHYGRTTYLVYGHCSFAFNRNGQATSAFCN
jgi:hypothetical protein